MLLHRLTRVLPLWLAAAWAMSLATLGLMVVPMLFANLPSPALAGNMAAKLFSAQTWVSTGCALGLLLVFRSSRAISLSDSEAQRVTLLVLAGMLLALLVEFAVAPHIIARDNLKLWHAVGSAMYLAQWLCALLVFAQFGGKSGRSPE